MPPKKKKGGGDATPRSDDKPAAAAEAPDEPEDDTEEEAASGNKRDGADVSKVTDFVEQKELDSAKASKAIASITAEEQVDREAEAARERELAAVSIEQVRVTRGVLACVAAPRPSRRGRVGASPFLSLRLRVPSCSHVCPLSLPLSRPGGRRPDRHRDGARQGEGGAHAARAQGRRGSDIEHARRRVSRVARVDSACRARWSLGCCAALGSVVRA